MFPASFFPTSFFPSSYFAGGTGTGAGGGGGGGGTSNVVRVVSPTIGKACTQTVYLRARWYEEWQEVDGLWCESAEWTVAPTMPTAELRWRYGYVLLPGSAEFAARFRIERPRYYAKIVFENASGEYPEWSREWYGVIELEAEDIQGPRLIVGAGGGTFYRTTGINKFIAYGMESLLDSHYVTSSRVGAGAQIVKRAITFNHHIDKTGEGNRSTGNTPGGPYVFHHEPAGGDEWSTANIVEYLLHYHTPRKTLNHADVPFVLGPNAADALPQFDEPELAAEGKTTRELMNVLLSRQRLLGYYVDVDEEANQVRLRPFTYTAEDIVLSSLPFAYYTANPNQKILATEKDRTCGLIVKRSTADQFDRVVARGARRTSTGSFSFTESTLAKGWPIALEQEYEAGASTAGDYPAAGDIGERDYRNTEARKADKFKSVYSRFVLPPDWGGYVGDGETLADQVLMPSDADEDTPESLAPEDLRFRKTTVLLDGHDYSDGRLSGTKIGDGPFDELPPIVLFRRYDWQAGNRVYRETEKVSVTAAMAEAGVGEDELWSARVEVSADGSLMLDVDGMQHWIAKTDFARLPGLDPEPLADFREMIVTATVEWSQFSEASYPDDLPFNVDAPRELLILAGEQFRCDYLAPGTVVGLDPADGTLERSYGGYIKDDRLKLLSIARQAYEWYTINRRAITYDTRTITGDLQLGDFILSLGDPDFAGDIQTEEVNSVVTSIRLTMQVHEGDAMAGGLPPAPSIRYETGYGELDPLTFVRGSL